MGEDRPRHSGATRDQLVELLGLAALLTVAAPLAFFAPAERMPEAGSSLPAPAAVGPCIADPNGAHFSGQLYGGIRAEIDWRGPQLTCGGMQRPQGGGMRLIFAPADEGETDLTFVIGIDAQPDAAIGHEYAANVTIIDAGSGSFYSSRRRNRCWATLDRLERVAANRATLYRVDADVYCSGALPALNAAGSITLRKVSFSGEFSPDAPPD